MAVVLVQEESTWEGKTLESENVKRAIRKHQSEIEPESGSVKKRIMTI